MRAMLVPIMLASLGVAVPAAAQTGYALYTEWQEAKLDLATCKRKAEYALRNASFTQDLSTAEFSVYARREGGYTVGIRCIPDKEIVFFVISGPDGTVANKHLDLVIDNF